METDKIKEFIKIAKDEGVQELKYESDSFKISVAFSSGAAPITYATQPSAATSQTQITTNKPTKEAGVHDISSPFVGTFYNAAAPGEEPFVSVGQRVKKGQTLCILEAMKIMNEIESDVDGEIIEICLENENLVEFGEVLFRIRK